MWKQSTADLNKEITMKNRLTALLLTAVMLLTLTPTFRTSVAEASGIPPRPTGNVEQRIAALRARFPHGAFFSANGRVCTHERREICNNCRLSDTMRSMGYPSSMGIHEAWTCVAFARYAFFYIFGVTADTGGYSGIAPTGSTRITAAQMRIGDVAVWANRHWAIYLGNGRYYQSNIRGTNQVDYNTTFSGTPDWAFRANNYDAVNGGTSNPPNPPEPPNPPTGDFFPRFTGSSESIVDALNSLGIDASFASRSAIAAANGISEYSGTAAQNVAMLNLLRAGTLLRPGRTPPPPEPPVLPPAVCDFTGDCRNCDDCGLLGGRFGFGRVTNNGVRPGVADALQILRFLVDLPTAIHTCNDARGAANIINPGLGRPKIQDALTILRFIVDLPTPLGALYER
jgi:hypothetical protein